MLWFLLALLTAISFGFYNITLKKASKDGDALAIIYVVYFLTGLFIFLYAVLTSQLMLPESSTFWVYALISAAVNAVVASWYVEALKSEDIGLSVPLLNLSPVFLIFTSVIIAHEVLTPVKVVGVLIIVSGIYLLNLSNGGLLQPFRAISSSRGSLFMLIIALTWGVTAAMDKVCITLSNPVTYGTIIFALITAFLTIGLVAGINGRAKNWSSSRHGNAISRLKRLKAKQLIFLTGIISSIMLITQFTAVSLGNVAYVIPIKRTGTLISVIGGIYLFNEKRSLSRMIGALTMVLGVFIIALF